MLLLTTSAQPTMLKWAHPHHGRLLTPRHYSAAAATAAAGTAWAVDNDCFQGLSIDAYDAMLSELAGIAGCLFVTVPDVVGDATATARQWVRWQSAPRRRGLPLAFVAQDGCIERDLVPLAHEFDCLFLGGTEPFRHANSTRQLVRAAKRAGKWIHVGRVNSARRIRWAAGLGADSIDGTGWAVWRDANLPRGLAATQAATAQGRLL